MGSLADASQHELGLSAVLWALLDALSVRLAALAAGEVHPLLDTYRATSVILGRRVQVWDEAANDIRSVR